MRVRFAQFTFDSGRQQLLADGVPVPLSPKAVDLLRLLLEHRPDVVDKQTIATRVWPRTHVTDASLTVVVAELRRVLGDVSDAPTFIRTAHRRGYAFIAPAEDLEERATAATARFWLVLGDRTVILPPGETIIGRDPACAVWLNVPSVSGRHARLVVTPTAATIEDLHSTNGTLVDGTRAEAPVALRHGSVIRLGDVSLSFGASGRQALARTERLPEPGKR